MPCVFVSPYLADDPAGMLSSSNRAAPFRSSKTKRGPAGTATAAEIGEVEPVR